MPMQKPAMGSAGAGVAVALAIWVCVLMPSGGLGSRPVVERSVSAAGKNKVMDDAKMKKLLSNCSPALLDTNFAKTSMNGDFVTDSPEVHPEMRMLENGDIQKAIALLPPLMKHNLLDCLGKQNLPSRVSGKDDSPKRWYSELEFLLGWHATSRQQLADKSSQARAPASVPAPSPALEPAHTPIPVTDLPSHTPATPVFAPVNALNVHSPANSPKEKIPSFPDGESPRAPSNGVSSLPSMDNDSNNRRIIVAIVLTATASVLFTALFFCCYIRCCRNKSDMGSGQRDDRPLLTLSSSDFSIGSSQKSFGLSNSIHPEKIRTLSFQSEPNGSGLVSSLPSHSMQIVSLDTNTTDPSPSGQDPGISSFSIEPSANTATPIITPTPRPPPPPPVMTPMKMSMPPPPAMTHLKMSAMPPPVMAPPMKMSVPPPNPPLPPLNVKLGPRPPIPPNGAFAPRPPQAPLVPKHLGKNHSGQERAKDVPKTKLKPLFWDKVLANPDQSMVWHQINSGSFQFSEEMIETLFGYVDKQKNADKRKAASFEPSPQYVHILDPKKSQNLAILLRALNVTTEEVCDALIEGNELPMELLQMLLKMPPTSDEELKLRLYNGELSELGPAERFLKALVDIPFAFKRLDVLLFMSSLEEDASNIKKDLATIEAACKELKNSRLFKKLLEAVVKIGNRLNDGTYRGGAQAFKLDTLLKLADVKGTDGKTTLLHFVVQEIIRYEGMRAERDAKGRGGLSSLTTVSSVNSDDYIDDAPHESGDHYSNLGLKVVSGLTSELENVKNAAILDADTLTNMVGNLAIGLVKTKEFLNKDMRSMEEDSGFHSSLEGFVQHAEPDVTSLVEEEKRIRLLVKSTTDFFHGNSGKDEGLHLFVIVRNFLGMLDKACKEVGDAPKRVPRTSEHRDMSNMPSLPVSWQLPFPSIRERQLDLSGSDDGSP